MLWTRLKSARHETDAETFFSLPLLRLIGLLTLLLSSAVLAEDDMHSAANDAQHAAPHGKLSLLTLVPAFTPVSDYRGDVWSRAKSDQRTFVHSSDIGTLFEMWKLGLSAFRRGTGFQPVIAQGQDAPATGEAPERGERLSAVTDVFLSSVARRVRPAHQEREVGHDPPYKIVGQ